MKVAVIGGGPAGLYFAYLLRTLDPASDVTLFERNPRTATYGFGVVFSDNALDYLRLGDAELYRRMAARMERWADLTVVHKDEAVPIDGNGFSAIARLQLLEVLQQACAEAGVTMRFAAEAPALADLAGHDLIVAADGVNSQVRAALAEHFKPRVGELTNRFAWYGTSKTFDTLTLTFRETAEGAFVGHHYRYSPGMSTFIVECDAATWHRSGLAAMDEAGGRRFCEAVFAADLDGHPLMSNKSIWRRFPVVTNGRWHHDRVVLLGDALRTVHFSIGSGTRLAMEDAIFLRDALAETGGDVATALPRYEATRRPVVDKLLAAAESSFSWYESFGERMHLDAPALAYDYMTRSGRVDDERLRRIAPRFMQRYEAAARTGGALAQPDDQG